MTKISSAITLIVPALFVMLGLSFHAVTYDNDPDYGYLLNGLNIAELHPVVLTAHPGTTVQWLSAAVLRCVHVLDLSDPDDIQASVLKDPDRYIRAIRAVLLLLIGLALLWLGLTALRLTGNLLYAILLQLTPFWSVTVLYFSWTKVWPEPMLVFASIILVIALLRFCFDDNRESRRHALHLGLISGFGLATKATFLPLTLIPLIVLPQHKRRLQFIAYTVLAFVLLTLPALPEYLNMLRWFEGMATHTEKYGKGPSGFVDWAQYKAGLAAIIRVDWLLVLFAFLGATAWIALRLRHAWRERQADSLAQRFLLAATVALVGGILLVSRHFNHYYLIPEWCLSGLLMLAFLLAIERLGSTSRLLARAIFPTLLLISACLLFFHSTLPALRGLDRDHRTSNEETLRVQKLLASDYSGYAAFYYYPYSLNPYAALKWGNAYAKLRYSEALACIWPKALFFDARFGTFFSWETHFPVEDILDEYGSRLLLVGGPMTEPDARRVRDNGLSITPLYRGRSQAIYHIDVKASPLFALHRKTSYEATCDAEALSPDGEFYLSGEKRFKNQGSQSRERSRSGSFSAKLSGPNAFAMEHELKDVRTGERITTLVWRLASHDDAFLVVSASDPALFYLQTGNPARLDEKGWQLLSLAFTATEKLERATLKVYVWNNSRWTAYFDDMRVTRSPLGESSAPQTAPHGN